MYRMKEYFKNDTHIFEVNINETPYGIHIKIGGKAYNDCINISIDNDEKTKAKISHIQSEPECFNDSIDTKDTVNFIKASLQFVNHKYPTIKSFEFDDMSKIECGKKRININVSLRKMNKPLLLAPMYIGLSGETWYETKFGAKMINEEYYSNYKENTKHLDKIIDIKYEKFKWKNKINEKQDTIISKYYSTDKTWKQFFNDIPKKDRCDALFNWIPDFIETILNHTYREKGWYIDINTMKKTHMEIVDNYNIIGGNKTRKINNKIKFTNSPHYDRNGFIFDGGI